MIIGGRVAVNGRAAVLGQSARLGYDDITVDGVPLEPKKEPVYIMLNKPRGYITTVKDDRGRKTVMDLVSDLDTKVYPVGRLDMASEGLLLMTNDGHFAGIVAHPSSGKTKKYEVRVHGDILAAADVLRRPMIIDARSVQAASVEVSELSGDTALLSIAVYEGLNRQIRKMCARCGLKVHSLKRVAVGPLDLGSLESGQWRFLTDNEVRLLTGISGYQECTT